MELGEKIAFDSRFQYLRSEGISGMAALRLTLKYIHKLRRRKDLSKIKPTPGTAWRYLYNVSLILKPELQEDKSAATLILESTIDCNPAGNRDSKR